MKHIVLSSIIILSILTSCDNEENPIQNDCIEMSKNPDWTTENFKTYYTIQFPKNYEGRGMVGFEGFCFDKNRIDDKVKFSYCFLGPVYCDDFGGALDFPIPNSIITKDKKRNEVTLDSKKEFCSNGNLIGIFYFNTETNSTGIFYMKQDTVYLNGVTIHFVNTEYQEVENIIKTISEN